MKCLTRQWLELTISAYRSRIAYLPHCTQLCYPEQNASSFLNRICRIILLTENRISVNSTTKSYSNFLTKNIKTKRNLVAIAVRVLIPIISFDFVVLCGPSAPLASSIYRVYTLPPALWTHIGFKKGILAV